MLDELREQHGLSKADLARAIDKNPASVRRLFTAPVNPELRTVVAIAEALDAEVQIVPRKRTRIRTQKGAQGRLTVRRGGPGPGWAGSMPWGDVYYKTRDGSVPAEAFLDLCPLKVEALPRGHRP